MKYTIEFYWWENDSCGRDGKKNIFKKKWKQLKKIIVGNSLFYLSVRNFENSSSRPSLKTGLSKRSYSLQLALGRLFPIARWMK